MARHDDRERVAPERLPDGARRAGRAEPRRDLAVRERRARRNGARHLVDAAMERRHALHVERDGRTDRSPRRAGARRCRRARAAPRAAAALRARREIARSRRARVSASRASGSCTPTTPRSPHAMPQRPIAVSKSAKPCAVMMPPDPSTAPTAPLGKSCSCASLEGAAPSAPGCWGGGRALRAGRTAPTERRPPSG